MRDINLPLRRAYYRALQATNLPVYYQFLPNNINPDNYIVFRGINSNDTSTKSSSNTLTSVIVEIHTVKDVANPGIDADNIANDVYTFIYAISMFVLPVDGVQMVSTRLSNDTVQDFQISSQKNYISRFITFEHNIFQNAEFTPNFGGAVNRYEYTATGGETEIATGLLNKRILDVNKDGISFSKILTEGIPVAKEVTYSASTGNILFPIEFEPDEELFIVYQNL